LVLRSRILADDASEFGFTPASRSRIFYSIREIRCCWTRQRSTRILSIGVMRRH